jgi:hypothetical protein
VHSWLGQGSRKRLHLGEFSGHFRPLGVEDKFKFLGDEMFEAAFGGLDDGAPLRSNYFKQIR